MYATNLPTDPPGLTLPTNIDREEMVRRLQLQQRLEHDTYLQLLTMRHCSEHCVDWINDFAWTYDPRNAETGESTFIPFVLRDKQIEFIAWLDAKLAGRENGLVEKSRDEGMSWTVIAYFVHKWLFVPGFKAGMGSRKLEYVDLSGSYDALFPKIRVLLEYLPRWMMPRGWNPRIHDKYCRIINPENDASITGEGGDNIGRGGRSTMYLIDEHAKLQDADSVEMAISQNSNCIIYGSTPSGVGNLFYQKRHSGKIDVFTFHWRDNPAKNYSATRVNAKGETETYYPWYEAQVAKYDAVTIAQEIDIDYAASAKGVVIPAKFVQAALDLVLERGKKRTAGADVSDNGDDLTVYIPRAGGLVLDIREIQGDNTTVKAREVIREARSDTLRTLYYDRNGVGAGFRGELETTEGLPFRVIGVMNGSSPTDSLYDDDPDLTASERFEYRADELWWSLMLRFKRTWERVTGIREHPDEDCISLFLLKGHPKLPTLQAQLSQPTYKRTGRDKLKVNKYGEGTKSPDFAEALMYAYAVEEGEVDWSSMDTGNDNLGQSNRWTGL